MRKSVIALLHTGYWTIYALLLGLFHSLMNIDRIQPILSGWSYPAIMFEFAALPGAISFYVAYTILFRRFFSQRRVLLLLVSGIGVSIAATIVGEIAMYATFILSPINWSIETCITMGVVMAFNALLNAAMGLVLKGFITNYTDIRLKEELTRRNYETEIALLKSRINPHFLFNTINNIDVLILKDAAKASEYLNRLSDILRFMLYDTAAEKIPLSAELACIEKYIALQRLRTANPDYVIYSVTGKTDRLHIAPMLFIPFIENAFKHAENKRVENAISITIAVEPGRLILDCKNAYKLHAPAVPGEAGIGNSLIQKRLQLWKSCLTSACLPHSTMA